MNGTQLMISMLIGTIGMGYFVYGKKSTDAWFMISGVALMGYPYFVDGVLLMVVMGVGLCALPFMIRRFF